MIHSLYAYNQKNDLFYFRSYSDKIFDRNEINNMILNIKNCNFSIQNEFTTVFKEYNGIYFVIIAENENEMYLLNILNLILGLFDKFFEQLSETAFVYNFKKLQVIIDTVIVDGIVIELDEQNILKNKVAVLN
ncbi:hypothetical protein NUSPORA_00007 [Nucleospora cyclopteri]